MGSRQMWMTHLRWTGRLFVVLSVKTRASQLARVNSAHLHALQGAASFEPAPPCLAKISPHPPAHLQHLQVLQGVRKTMASLMSVESEEDDIAKVSPNGFDAIL